MSYENYSQKVRNKMMKMVKMGEHIFGDPWSYSELLKIAEQVAGKGASPEKVSEIVEGVVNYSNLVHKANSDDKELAIHIQYVGVNNYMTFLQFEIIVDSKKIIVDPTEADTNGVVNLIHKLFPTSTLTSGKDLTMRGENELLVVHQFMSIGGMGTLALGRGKVNKVSALDCFEMVPQYLDKNMTHIDALKQYQIEMNKIGGVKNFGITQSGFTGKLDFVRFTVSFPGE
jgi:hypothetical protein